MNPLLELRGAGRIFGQAHGVTALRGVSLSVSAGEFVAVTGPSGSGKSTLLALMGALDVPTTGSISLGGRDIASMPDGERTRLRAEAIGFVFQQFHLVPFLTALGNVELALLYRGLSRKARREAASRALQSVGLGDRMEHRPSELSGGEQQRVAIARAVVTGPRLVLADEPTGNLDSAHAGAVLEVLSSVVTPTRCLVVATHSEAVAARASRCIRLHDGQVAGEEVLA